MHGTKRRRWAPGAVSEMADDVGVMHSGVLVEQGPVDTIFDNPQADYTRMLLNAVPDISKVE